MNDTIRAAIIAFIQSVFPVLSIAGVVEFTADQISAIMLLINNGLTMFFLVYKTGQQKGPAS